MKNAEKYHGIFLRVFLGGYEEMHKKARCLFLLFVQLLGPEITLTINKQFSAPRKNYKNTLN